MIGKGRGAWLLSWVGLLGGCGDEGASPPPGRSGGEAIRVVAGNEPLRCFAEWIGGAHVAVSMPAPGGEDPAFWMPEGPEVGALQEADLIVLNGAGYEKWPDRLSLPLAAQVDTSRGFRDRFIVLEGEVTHGHGPEGEHSHAGTAFTTWLDLSLARLQAAAIRDALLRRRPDAGDEFERAFAALDAELAALDERLLTLAPALEKVQAAFSHPVYQYLSRRYRLAGPSFHFEPGEPVDLAAVESVARERPIRFLVWEAPPLAETVERLAALGIESVVVEPCGGLQASGDFMDALRRNVAVLEQLALAAAN